MARQSFVYRDGKVIPKEDARPRPGLQIITDIAPYQSIVDRSVIGGRRQHRDHLRAHGCIEVGNEPVKPQARPDMPVGSVGEDVKRAFETHE